jgi:hypothetical protein
MKKECLENFGATILLGNFFFFLISQGKFFKDFLSIYLGTIVWDKFSYFGKNDLIYGIVATLYNETEISLTDKENLS